MLVVLSRLLGLLYFYNNLDEKSIHARIPKFVRQHILFFLPLFFYVLGSILFQDGYGYEPKTGEVFVASMKILHNFMANPLLALLLLLGIGLFLYGLTLLIYKYNDKAIWFTGLGVVLIVTMLLFSLGLNHTVMYPSLSNLQSSLTIANSSGSLYTLKVMAYVSVLVPVVLGYIFFVWRSMDKHKMTIDEVKSDHHHY